MKRPHMELRTLTAMTPPARCIRRPFALGGLLGKSTRVALQVHEKKIVSMIGPNVAGKGDHCIQTGLTAYKPSDGRLSFASEGDSGLPGFSVARQGHLILPSSHVAPVQGNDRALRTCWLRSTRAIEHQHARRLFKTPPTGAARKKRWNARPIGLERFNLHEFCHPHAVPWPTSAQRRLEIAR